MKRLGHWIGVIATVAAVLLAALILVPSILGYERYVIESGSMQGTIDKGSIVYSEKAVADDLRVGDIITFKPPPEFFIDDLVTHRIISIRRQQLPEPRPDAGAAEADGQQQVPDLLFRTKGDANADPDPWEFKLDDDAAAVEKAHVPYVGYVYLALAIPWVRIVVIIIPAILIAVLTAISLWRAAGEEAEAERERIEREKMDREGQAAAEKEPV
jgi:signal peptidase I